MGDNSYAYRVLPWQLGNQFYASSISSDLIFGCLIISFLIKYLLNDFLSPSMTHRNYYQQLLNFLRQDLSLSDASLAIAERTVSNSLEDSNHLPIVLWQYGLITLEELDRIFDWLETV
ncbi:MAG: hypothetical protein RLZZ490_821 [Cyanobacteriota bacterium]|jgi:multisubunit Na+/H+ antiporter MnhE subunit